MSRENEYCADDVTDYYRKYPVVLVRLSEIDRDGLRDLLSMTWRLTLAKTRARARSPRYHPRAEEN